MLRDTTPETFIATISVQTPSSVGLHIVVGENSKRKTSILLYRTTAMCTMVYGAEKSLPSVSFEDKRS